MSRREEWIPPAKLVMSYPIGCLVEGSSRTTMISGMWLFRAGASAVPVGFTRVCESPPARISQLMVYTDGGKEQRLPLLGPSP